MYNVELLAPAGSPEALDAAVAEGADAVYLGLKSFNARMRSANFAYSQFEGALRSLHRMGRKVYVTVNTVFEQREADRVYQLLKYLAGLGPDGIIVQDFGIAAMARQCFPSLKLHASTQMNIASARGANLLSKCGISRVVLARELSLEEIRSIRSSTNLTLEVFVHGALCVSASGLCLFSSFLGGKSANRGMCTQACRRLYHVAAAASGVEGREGYFFSPADLQLIQHVPALIEAGAGSFKIEGRMKSAGYVGTVVAAYRKVIDNFLTRPDEADLEKAMEILRGDFARSKTVFYFESGVSKEIPWLNPGQDGGTGFNLGSLLQVKGGGEDRRGLISAASLPPGGLSAGDTVRLHRADDSNRRSHRLKFVEREKPGASSGPEGRIWISIPEGFTTGDPVYLIQNRAVRYAPVIPKNLAPFRRSPGREKAPEPDLPLPARREAASFPEGLYPLVSSVEDLYVLQSVRPQRVMLDLTPGTAGALLKDGPLPFSPDETILVLDPYFSEAREEGLRLETAALMEKGYRQFMVNNPGHFSFFRTAGAALIAGPYLYTFNRWATAFISALGTPFMVSPLENNRQNLERTFPPPRRAFCFVPVFAYPALFRIRADLSALYDFQRFEDRSGEGFRLVRVKGGEGSLVIPQRPFSIVDKVPFLKEAGFRRFILDFSGSSLKKKDYKDIMAALENCRPLNGTERFNWKDGFYSSETAGIRESEDRNAI